MLFDGELRPQVRTLSFLAANPTNCTILNFHLNVCLKHSNNVWFLSVSQPLKISNYQHGVVTLSQWKCFPYLHYSNFTKKKTKKKPTQNKLKLLFSLGPNGRGSKCRPALPTLRPLTHLFLRTLNKQCSINCIIQALELITLLNSNEKCNPNPVGPVQPHYSSPLALCGDYSRGIAVKYGRSQQIT